MSVLHRSRKVGIVCLIGVVAAIAAATLCFTGEAPAEANLALHPRPLDHVRPQSNLRTNHKDPTVALVLGGTCAEAHSARARPAAMRL